MPELLMRTHQQLEFGEHLVNTAIVELEGSQGIAVLVLNGKDPDNLAARGPL